jgi:RNA polymerase sigma factor (sigma-70 family)
VDLAQRRRRWQLVLPHRPYLVGIAVRRGMSWHDAEDCAHEAMVRCVAFPGLDESRVPEFLASTTMRLCVDRHRLRARDERVGVRLGHVDEPSPEERACDRAEAVWVAGHVAALPESQRTALAARAEGLSCDEIATRMELSYKAVESLLSRARAHIRAAVASAYVLLARTRRRGWHAPVAIGAMSVVAMVAVSALGPHPGSPPGVRRAFPESTRAAARVATPAPAASPRPAVARPAPAPRLTPPPGPDRSYVPRDAGGPGEAGGPIPVPSVTPPDPCDVRLPHAELCVPTSSYRPGQGLDNCLRYGLDLSQGFECRTAPPRHP